MSSLGEPATRSSFPGSPPDWVSCSSQPDASPTTSRTAATDQLRTSRSWAWLMRPSGPVSSNTRVSASPIPDRC